MKRFFYMLLLLEFYLPVYAQSTAINNKSLTDFPWAVMGYWGKMTDSDLSQIIVLQPDFVDETVYSLEFSHQLATDNLLRVFFQPIATTVEVVANFTYRDDPIGPIYEVNPYFTLRWANLPWNRFVRTSF